MLRSLFTTSSDSSSESDTDEEIQAIPFEIQSIESKMTKFISQTSGCIIELKQNPMMGIAHQLWPAAILLCNYLEENLSSMYPSSNTMDVIELGSGIGLCGIFLAKAKLVNNVIVTDTIHAMDLLHENIAVNQVENQVSACELYWGNQDHVHTVMTHISSMTKNQEYINPFQCNNDTRMNSSLSSTSTAIINNDLDINVISHKDKLASNKHSPPLIIASDCVYWENLYEPFYNTLHQLIYEYNCDVIISHVKRWKKDSKFFKMCQKTIIVETLYEHINTIIEEYDQRERKHIQRIYKLSKKNDS